LKRQNCIGEAIQADPEITAHLLLAEFLLPVDANKLKELLASIKSLPDANELRFALGLLYEQLNMSDKAVLPIASHFL